MKKLYLYSFCLLFLAVATAISQPWLNENVQTDDFYSVQKSFNDYWEGKELVRGEGWKQFRRWEYFWAQRVFPTGKIPYPNDIWNSYINFLNSTKNNPSLMSLESEWIEAGPIQVPTNKLVYKSGGLGRLNVVRIHPHNDNILWVGSAGGGAWSSTDKGQSWTKAKYTDILSLGVSDIAISESKPDVMYIATGDKNGFFMTNHYSIGILKSVDGGKNWAVTSEIYKPNDYFLANRIIIHPTNHNLVYAATNKGIIKSTDGASTWKVINGNAVFRDIEFNPVNPLIIYATTSGMNQGTSSGRIFRSTDGGDTWNLVLNLNGSSRIDLAITYSNPNFVYAIAAKSNSGAFHSLLRSTDAGATFKSQSTSPNILSIDRNGGGSTGQGFYDLAIAVSPTNPNFVFAGGIHSWASTDGGVNWKILNHWTGSYNLPYVHADQHHYTINPRNGDLYVANDGGLYISKDNGASWTDISSGLGIAQYYKINVSPADNEMIIAGAQDNGSQIFRNNEWSQINGGDGMDCAIDPIEANYVYSTTQYGNLYRSTNYGNSFNRIAGPDIFQNESANWVTPFILNPLNPASIYIGYRNVYKTTNRGASWVKVTNFTNSAPINLLAISEIDTNIMYMVVRNYLYKSTNGGANWTSIFNKSSFISGIDIDPENPHRIFITLSGYIQAEKVFEIVGNEVKNISFNLPNLPVNTIKVQNNSAGRLFIGTDVGVMVKPDDFTESWESYSNNLPPVVVNDLKINYSTGKLYAGTYGRGVWTTKLFNCDVEKPTISAIGNIQFCKGDSVVLKANTIYPDIKWSTGEKSQSITVKKTGFYFFSVKNDMGCAVKSETLEVIELDVPAFSIKSNKGMVLCGEDSILLSVPFGQKKYSWSTGDTTFRISINEPGNYIVSAMSNSGCQMFDSVYIPKRPLPKKPLLYQNGDTLYTDSSYGYVWYVDDKEVPNSNKREIVAGTSGSYYVVALNEYGCGTSSDSKDVITSVENNVFSKELINISPNPFTDFLNINSQIDLNNAEIVIIDNLGRELYKDYVHSIPAGHDYILNLDSFSQGSFVLLIKTQSNIFSYNLRRLN